jgi:RimJ/RimL family protein N-acetyltransferase
LTTAAALPDLSHWAGVARPGRVTLEGRYTRLEPLDPLRHGDALHAAATAPGMEDRFRYLFESPPTDRADYQAALERAAVPEDPMAFAVIDRATGRAEGRQSLMRVDPVNGVIEVGSIMRGPAISRTPISTEAIYLFGSYVFETLGYRRFEWKCHSLNQPSQVAAVRLGFTYEGLFRQHMVAKGRNRDTAWFSMIDAEWPALAAAFEAWLEPGNFDETGRQKRTLDACRAVPAPVGA